MINSDLIPEWADGQLSESLPIQRARGEGQELEYIASFPINAQDLAKEIAAFASSNQGTILIGVADDGALIGLPDAISPRGRDSLLNRIQGMCRGTIKPAVTPTVRFAVEQASAVLVIIVPRGSEAIYYCNGRPYVRHITESCPAEPHEVVDRVRQWLALSPVDDEQQSPLARAVSRLAVMLSIVMIYCDEIQKRMYSPWLERWQAQFRQAAADLALVAIEVSVFEPELAKDCEDLSAALDSAVDLQPGVAWAAELLPRVDRVKAIAARLKSRWLDSKGLTQSSLRQMREMVVTASHKLRVLVSRGRTMVRKGNVDSFQSEVASIGFSLVQAGQFDLSQFREGLDDELKAVGRALHLVETKQHYFGDGGVSLYRTVDEVGEISERLNKIVESLG